MFCDNALSFNPATLQCDLAFDGIDLPIDTTPATPMLISYLANRRAQPDDVLPSGVTNQYQPTTLNARQGWVGDCFDLLGRRIGSRLWLLQGSKQTETTRLFAESATAEAFQWFDDAGSPVTITVRWLAMPRGFLAIVVQIANTVITFNASISASSGVA